MDIINTLIQWYIEYRKLRFIVLFAIFFGLARFITWFLKKGLAKIVKKTKTKIDDLILERLEKPVTYLIFLVVVKASFWYSEIKGFWNHIANSLLIIGITYVSIALIDILIELWGMHWKEKTKSRYENELLPLFHKFTKVLFAFLGFLFILSEWGVAIGPFLAGLGIGGIAIAFALQNTLGNVFGGISMIMDRTVKVGDVIKVDQDTRGYVLEVGLRATKIRTFDNEVIIVPNGKLAESKIQNYVLPDPKLRIVIKFGVEYGSNIDKVKKVVLKAIKKIEAALDDPEPVVYFLEMSDFSLNFMATLWIRSFKDRFASKDKATTLIYNELRKAGIGIPFPTRTIYMEKKKK